VDNGTKDGNKESERGFLLLFAVTAAASLVEGLT
jgi:hypothetical protein